MSEMCHGCAFRQGCETNSQPYNTLRSTVAALGPIPFYCHEPFDWQNAKPSKPGEFRVCEGWKKRVRANRKRGLFAREPRMKRGQRNLAARTLILIQAFVDEKEDARRKLSLKRRLLECMETLNFVADLSRAERGGNEVQP